MNVGINKVCSFPQAVGGEGQLRTVIRIAKEIAEERAYDSGGKLFAPSDTNGVRMKGGQWRS